MYFWKPVVRIEDEDEGVLLEAQKYQKAYYGEWSKKNSVPLFYLSEELYVSPRHVILERSASGVELRSRDPNTACCPTGSTTGFALRSG